MYSIFVYVYHKIYTDQAHKKNSIFCHPQRQEDTPRQIKKNN